MAQYTILFADSEQDTSRYFAGILKANGFEASSTTSGVEALNLYRSQSPDLVIADLILGDKDGITLLEELKSFDPTAKVILTTDNAGKDLITRAFRMGVLDILEKPVDPEALISKVRELLANADRALEGNLDMMSLASIVQINCEERNQAQLSLNYQGKTGSIYFDGGEMIHAETANLSGEEALYSLLGWEDGSFKVKMGATPAIKTITKNWSGLLLEGMRRIDESTAGWSHDWESEFELADEPQKNQVHEKIARAILSHRDVNSVVIFNPDGTQIAQENSSDPEADLELGLLLFEQTNSIGGFLESGDPERIVISGSNERYSLHVDEDELILLSLTKRSSAEKVNEELKTIQKRYQSA